MHCQLAKDDIVHMALDVPINASLLVWTALDVRLDPPSVVKLLWGFGESWSY